MQAIPRSVLRRALYCAVLSAAASAPAWAGTVEVRISAVAAGKGKVNVAVCDKERFLKDCVYTGSVPAQGAEAVVTIPNVPKGSWAVLAYQDENQNNKLDRNLLGIPSENYAFSRDARGKFGPPDFSDAAIEVRDEPTVAAIKLR